MHQKYEHYIYVTKAFLYGMICIVRCDAMASLFRKLIMYNFAENFTTHQIKEQVEEEEGFFMRRREKAARQLHMKRLTTKHHL